MLSIKDVASKINLVDSDLYLYGNEMAKIVKPSDSNSINGKLILVTAINPTKYGEGKTTMAIGLNDALCSLKEKAVVVLREPSLGPVFGLKGGATGGGKAKVIPEDKINLHFTGDFHAITSANNLMCAALYNHIYQGNDLNINKDKICIKRCLDVNDRELRGNFNITAASEVMAIFCLASSYDDLKNRLANILVAYDMDDKPIYCSDLKVDGAMYKLLVDSFSPNLVQTLEGNPALIHGGPFANIAHGCNSIVATKLGLSLANYVVTEAGFGSDLGCEKFIDIKCRYAGIKPSMIVLTTTVRALKYSGIDNLQAHIDNLNNYNIPFCVSINQFLEDKNEDIEEIKDYCLKQNIKCFVCDPFNKGGAGCIKLAQYILNYEYSDTKVNNIYDLNLPVVDKIKLLATKVYHAASVSYTDRAKMKLSEIDKLGISHYPICICKTPLSLSDDETKLGYPKDYEITVKDIIIQTGSRMIIVILNNTLTMPGLPKNPNYISM